MSHHRHGIFALFFALNLHCDESKDFMPHIERLEGAIRIIVEQVKKLSRIAEKQLEEEKKGGSKHAFRIIEPQPRTTHLFPRIVIDQKFPQKFPEAFQTMLSFLANSYFFLQASAKVPNKFLLYGPPGCGKSYLAELIAHEFELPMIYLKASDLEDRYYGESTKKITELFSSRDPHGRPLIIFIDEIDAIASQRNEKTWEGRRSTTNALLVELQKISFDTSVIVLVATNDKESLDKAFLSRFEGLCVEIKPMNQKERKLFLEDLLQELSVKNKQKTIDVLTKKTKGLSRRAIATAIESANAWSVCKYEYSSREITVDDIMLFINQANIDSKASFSTTLKDMINEVSPYLNFSHTLLGTALTIMQLSKYESIRAPFRKISSSIINLTNQSN